MIRKSKWLICLLVICCAMAHAQQFKMNAKLGSVPSTGFYKIQVNPELAAYAKADFSDIRIADEKGSYIPYITRNREPRLTDETLYANTVSILSNTTDSTYTTLILQKSNIEMNVSGLYLLMNNTSVERYAQLSGSDNNRDWYIIDEHVLLHRSDFNGVGRYAQDIFFPPSKYLYFKLKIDNAHTDPLAITGVRAILNATPRNYTVTPLQNPAPKVYQKDSSNGKSYVTIINDASFLVNKFTIDIAGARFYERNAAIYILHDINDSASLNYAVAGCIFTSSKPAEVYVPAQKVKAIVLEIDNFDNPPLKIARATTFQDKQHIVAWLEQDKNYKILVGNSLAAAPVYDLNKFTDSIPTVLQELSYGTFTLAPKVQPTAAKPVKSTNYILWTVIVIGVIAMGGLTYKLVKEVK